MKYVSFNSLSGERSTKQHIMIDRDGKAISICGRIRAINEDEKIYTLDELEDEHVLIEKCCKTCLKINSSNNK